MSVVGPILVAEQVLVAGRDSADPIRAALGAIDRRLMRSVGHGPVDSVQPSLEAVEARQVRPVAEGLDGPVQQSLGTLDWK